MGNNTTLTIYTSRFDSKENVVNGGMSGKAFLDIDNRLGMSFKCLDEALEYIVENSIEVHHIEFNYLDHEDIQMFKRYNVEP